MKSEGALSIALIDTSKSSWLSVQEHKGLRVGFILGSILLFTVLGLQYYSFPMWLNQIVADNQSLSREALAVLGGSAYVALGVFGGMLLGFKKLVPDRHHGFRALSIFAAISISTSWGLMYWLATTPEHVRDHAVIITFLMIFIALSVGVFYMVWFGGEIMRLMNPRYHFVFIAIGNIVFSGGAVIGLCARLVMGPRDWMLMTFLIVTATATTAVFLAVYNQHSILAPDVLPSEPEHAEAGRRYSIDSFNSSHASYHDPDDKDFGFTATIKLIKDLLSWKRPTPAPDCDVTSVQFYFLMMSYVLVSCMSTTFMANLGALISEASDGEDDDKDDAEDHRRHTIILILSAVGQTIGRTFVAAAQYYADHAVAEHVDMEKRQVRVRNRSILLITLLIAGLFILSLLFLHFVKGGIDFASASTIISMAYGMMWCITSNFPSFIVKYDFSTLLSFMQICGATGTLVMTALVAGLELNNSGVFTLLFILSTFSAAATLIAFVLRVRAEST